VLNAGIKVEGLAAFRRDLKNIDPELQKTLRVDLLVIGQEIASEAAGKVPRGKTGKAAGSVRAGVSGNNAYVAGGKASVPYYGWLDFGSRTPKRGQPRSTGPWAKSGAGPQKGRFIYPTIEQNKPKVEAGAAAAFDKAAEAALKANY
jgi:hypothetical protein